MPELVKLKTIQELIPELGKLESLTDHLFIDFSSIAMKTLGSIDSANYVANEKKAGREPSNDIMDEWYYQIAKTMMILAGATNPRRVTIAIDSRPYWRNQFVADYYKKTNTYYWNPYITPECNGDEAIPGTWVCEREGTFIKCDWDSSVEEWVLSNVKVADKKEMGIEPMSDQWLKFEGGVLTPECAELALGIYGSAIPTDAYLYPPFTEKYNLFGVDKIVILDTCSIQ
jgi:hypothetical protein